MDCFAVCTPGLEDVLASELAGLGLRRVRATRRGATFPATARQLYAANAWLRTASRVVVRAGEFTATSFAALERQAAAMDWSPWLTPGVRPRFRVTTRASTLYHTEAIAERLTRVVSGASAAPDAPEQLVVVRVDHDRFTISVDSSGAHLHQRGWRLATAKAPLRETLAAAMVLASGWQPTTPFVDPLCGSGTIAIEAALIAAGRAPGAQRAFAFQRWPSFQPGTWASVHADVRRAETAVVVTLPVILAADRDAGAARAAAENAARAGVDAVVEVRRAPIAETLASLPSPPGWLVTNPPYGARVGGPDLRDLYATLGRATDWQLALLAVDRALVRHTGRSLTERLHTTNGGIPVTLWSSRPAR
jgi:putative N6-adenine-specific DNA methylase